MKKNVLLICCFVFVCKFGLTQSNEIDVFVNTLNFYNVNQVAITDDIDLIVNPYHRSNSSSFRMDIGYLRKMRVVDLGIRLGFEKNSYVRIRQVSYETSYVISELKFKKKEFVASIYCGYPFKQMNKWIINVGIVGIYKRNFFSELIRNNNYYNEQGTSTTNYRSLTDYPKSYSISVGSSSSIKFKLTKCINIGIEHKLLLRYLVDRGDSLEERVLNNIDSEHIKQISITRKHKNSSIGKRSLFSFSLGVSF